VRSHVVRFFLALLGVALLRADDSLAHARRAQALLGPGVWSQVVHVENSTPRGTYPRELHALVFELAGILWFYTDTDGTQSFSLRRDRLAEEKADFGPLLRAIEPGFVRWGAAPDGDAKPGKLPKGCFVESVAALRTRLARGEPAADARLLSYYVDLDGVRLGHTVLSYHTTSGIEVIDPVRPAQVRRFPEADGADALRLARALEGGGVAAARWVPVDLPPEHAGFFAGRGVAGPDDFGSAAAWTL
jgi:hypothetical protein